MYVLVADNAAPPFNNLLAYVITYCDVSRFFRSLLPHPRHRLADFPRRLVLRALLHHDGVHHSQQQRLPPGARRDLLLLALLAGLDRAAAAGLEQVRA